MALVCWSGGCDSTLILLDLATKATHENPVKALSISHMQIPAAKESRLARQKIKKWIKAKGYPVIYQEVVINHTSGFDIEDSKLTGKDVMFMANRGTGLFQPALWIPMAAMYMGPDDDAYFGYIQGDCLWHYKAEVSHIFNYLRDIMSKRGNIKFPLEWTDKKEVVERLHKLGVLEFCHSCESMTQAWCGHCTPCENRIAAEKKAGLPERPVTAKKVVAGTGLLKEEMKMPVGVDSIKTSIKVGEDEKPGANGKGVGPQPHQADAGRNEVLPVAPEGSGKGGTVPARDQEKPRVQRTVRHTARTLGLRRVAKKKD